MQRETDKHGSRLDEQMKHEVESLVHGSSAEESRAREDLTQEGPAEDEAPFASAADLDARADLARHVASAEWPASKDDLIQAARVDRAPQDLLDTLRRLPAEVRFETVQEVWAALGGATEDTHTHG
jgi:Protein of unknown function (DUF2795)